ncbi:hypothetical protein BJY04DRAFT_77541 [Aspergillus karnatakaensis]|uniref:Zn(II)2Cys6 transcription factor domain-containing protein n=1 Tax=Aspergillus karnatakaensis TaxID=1810916 RepID=UPI003CCCED92
MGGIPYTSTGCNTCRRRKVKCDETKPECLRCTKYGHQCTGYERKKVFVHRGGTAAEKSQKLASDPTVSLIRPSKPGIPRLNVKPELRSQLLTAFIDAYIPQREYLHDIAAQHLLHTLPSLTGSGGSAILERAAICLSTGLLAKQNQDERLLQYSNMLYGNTLVALNSKITSGAKLGQDILYTTIVLQNYELVNCSPPGFGAWIAHVQGGIAVSTQTSTHKEKTLAEKLFYRQMKFVTLCDAVGKRKPPYLYKTRLWMSGSSETGDSRDPLDELMDLLAECCAIMERVDRFANAQPGSSEKTRTIGEQILLDSLTLEENLHQVCVSMQQKLGAPKASPFDGLPQGDFRNSLRTDLFPDPLDFASVTCAESHLTYWSTLILLYPLIGEIYAILDTPPRDFPVPVYYDFTNGETADTATRASPGANISATYTALAEHYGGEICRSVLYCIQPNVKMLGLQTLIAHLSMAVQFFHVEKCTAKLKWSQDALMILGQLGMGLAPFLTEMIWPNYQAAHERRLSPQLVPET